MSQQEPQSCSPASSEKEDIAEENARSVSEVQEVLSEGNVFDQLDQITPLVTSQLQVM